LLEERAISTTFVCRSNSGHTETKDYDIDSDDYLRTRTESILARESLSHRTHNPPKQCQTPPMTISAPTARLTIRLHKYTSISTVSKGCGYAQLHGADIFAFGPLRVEGWAALTKHQRNPSSRVILDKE
jgi:hypothetical protein